MIEIVPKSIEEYAKNHSKEETPLLAEVREFTMKHTTAPQMLSGPLEGNFLKMVVRLTGAKRILELGTFTGYSALWMAQGLPKDGEMICCDLSPDYAKIARGFFDRSPHKNNIQLRVGSALETLETLSGPFDVAFIDADKNNYSAYYERCMQLVRPGGSILIDNAISIASSTVLNQDDPMMAKVHQLNEKILKDDRVHNVLLTIRYGIQWVIKK